MKSKKRRKGERREEKEEEKKKKRRIPLPLVFLREGESFLESRKLKEERRDILAFHWEGYFVRKREERRKELEKEVPVTSAWKVPT